FEEAAREEQKKVMEAARVAYYRIEEQVRDLERAGKFEQAIRRLEPAEHYPDEIRLRALARRNALGDAWARYRAEEAERAAREAETALAADEEEFGRVSREARRDVAAYDFGSAETKFASAEARLRTEKFRGRVLRRAAEMARLVDFKDTLRTMVNDPRSYPAFKREATFLGAGTIVKMDEREFTIRADGSGGTIGLGLKEIRSAAFYRFARGAWKWTDPKVVEALVIFCCEWGMYESALEEIAALQPWIDKDKAVAEFCETYKALIDAGDYSEWEEIEAEKRYGRLRQFAADGVLDDARREADILRTRYNATKFVANRKGEIEALLEEVLKQGGEDLKKKRRGEQYKRIQNSRSGARSQAGRNQPEILARLGQIRDALERDARLGEMYAAYGDWNRSTERLLEAKPLADRVLADRKQVREYALQVASVYVQLLRNAVVTGNRQGAIDWRNEAHAKFSDREWPAIAAWWAEVIRKVEQWEPLFREKSKAMSGLEKALREAPDEPERLWAVIEACWVTRDLMDARGYLRAYLEMFPDAPEARNGEAQYRLAETLLSFHEVKEALDLYRALARQYPEHPKVKDKKAEDGVERRWELCHDLMNKMGIKKEEGK
ncbi:MAG: hypothetical protein HYY16_00180, partial [Planctomycetes bacterium]|nr:hypothetical protein [Planctomycetota bacterium]